MKRLTGDKLDEAINKFGKKVVRDAKRNLTRERANASRDLWNSIRYTFNKEKLEISFKMLFYGAFLDKGVSGTGRLWYNNVDYTPVPYNKSDGDYSFKSGSKTIGGSLKGWLNAKGMDQKLDFVMRRSIAAKGIRPRRFFTYAFDRNAEELNGIISKAVGFDIDEELATVLSKLEN